MQNPALKTVTVTWDGAGRRRTLINPDGGIVTYSFSKRDQCVSLQNADGDRTSWTFDPASRQTVQLLANGVRVSLAYDEERKTGQNYFKIVLTRMALQPVL